MKTVGIFLKLIYSCSSYAGEHSMCIPLLKLSNSGLLSRHGQHAYILGGIAPYRNGEFLGDIYVANYNDELDIDFSWIRMDQT